jgi:hypothetical protein
MKKADFIFFIKKVSDFAFGFSLFPLEHSQELANEEKRKRSLRNGEKGVIR